MIQALSAKGYDKDGRLMGSLGAGQLGVELKGTVHMLLLQQCMDAKWNEVQKQAELVLGEVIELCQDRK